MTGFVDDPPRAAAAARVWRRDVALRRSRQLVAGVAVAAVGLSGLVSVVAARAFKGRQRGTPAPAPVQRARTPRVQVPAPDRIPSIAGDPAPLQAPEQPPAPAPTTAPAPADPVPAAPAPAAPVPQVSGGS